MKYANNISALSLLALFAGTATLADEAATNSEVVVVGTRGTPRIATQSVSPVDVISAKTLEAQGFNDINRALEYLLPSFNYPRAATGPSAANTRAATLRGLAPDQVLVLVNGKRWHASSVINFNNLVGRGSTPTDLNAIPMSAVEKIEVLRDGAAAQYGSDAIAGVINIVLKSSAGKGMMSLQSGVTEQGDGSNITGAINKGFAIGDKGFANLSGEMRKRNTTNRAAIDSRYNRITNQQGDPETLDLNLAVNAGYDLSPQTSVYGNLILDHRKATSPAQYRAPTISAVYPNGFIPLINLDLDDTGGTFGLKTQMGAWSFDFSDSPGYSRSRFDVDETVNTSLGLTGPTHFEAGGATYFQNLASASMTRGFTILSGANLAMGLEQRFENYRIKSGEALSFTGAGAQGFPGFNPPTPVDAKRNATSGYIDGELSVFEGLNLGAAARYEHYDDFGDATTGKLSLFYKPVNFVAIRATASTGFRAPSLQQSYFSTVTSQSSGGVLVNVGTFAVNDPVARALGASPPKAEKSKNISTGLVFTPHRDLSFTLDAYRIKIDDRIVLSETLSGATVTAVLKTAGVTNASQVRFFTNAAKTTTEGYDFTANWKHSYGFANVDITAAYMSVDTDLTYLKTNPALPTLPLLAISSIDFLTEAQPRNKATLSARLSGTNWSTSLNLTRFGAFRAVQVLSEQTFKAVTSLDLTASFEVAPGLSIEGGVLNATDAYPDKIAERALSQGGSLQYPEVGAIGTNGREYYLRLISRF